jgi:uncharacterized protein YqjF (DUF2071 family)
MRGNTRPNSGSRKKSMAIFLNAEWRKLAIANYAVDPSILAPFLPKGTEPDLWDDTCYVSLVGFLFLNTRLKGIKIPFHIDFVEANLRFYVKRIEPSGSKRGVVFIKEFVPRPALTFVANTFYGEHYQTVPMTHVLVKDPGEGTLKVGYSWKFKEWHSLTVIAGDVPSDIIAGSEEEFITEHYWGYTQVTSSRTSEYAVEHPRWQVYPVKDYTIDVNFERLYGAQFAFLNTLKPVSVFLAEGSEITVKGATVIQDEVPVILRPIVSEQSP